MPAATITQSYPAHNLDSSQRQTLALELIKKGKSVSDISKQNNVSRKFLYQQKAKAVSAIQVEFNKPDDSDVLFYLPVTKAWLMSFILCLLLHCRSSMRGAQKVLADAFDCSLSLGTICNQAQGATSKAAELNAQQDLSQIKTAASDELFRHNKPVLAGVDTRSLYCCLLAQEEHRDADTWAIHLMDLQKQGFNPSRFIADAANGLRLGHKTAFPLTPCHGDHFHIIKDLVDTRRFFRNQHKSAVSSWIDIAHRMDKAKLRNEGHKYSHKLHLAEQHEQQMSHLSKTIDTLVAWLQHDVLQLPGFNYHTRSELYDFIIDEFKKLEKQHLHRIKKIRVSLENQKQSLLAFTHIFDSKLQCIARQLDVNPALLWQMSALLRCVDGSDTYVIRSVPLLLELGDERFDEIETAVAQAIATTDRTSCMVENFNSHLSSYFFLRKEIGNEYLQLLQFYLNHTPFLRSHHEYRKGKTPTEIMTGKKHQHWLEMLGLKRFTRTAA